jgi:four helix bundle protein
VEETMLKDKAHFIDMAYGSLMETYSELETVADLGYITEEEVKNIKPNFVDVGKMLSGLRTSILSAKSDNQKPIIVKRKIYGSYKDRY